MLGTGVVERVHCALHRLAGHQWARERVAEEGEVERLSIPEALSLVLSGFAVAEIGGGQFAIERRGLARDHDVWDDDHELVLLAGWRQPVEDGAGAGRERGAAVREEGDIGAELRGRLCNHVSRQFGHGSQHAE